MNSFILRRLATRGPLRLMLFALLAACAMTVPAHGATSHPIYLVNPNGDLLSYDYLGAANASNTWGASQVKIGNGWNFRHLFSGGDGVIFAIDDNCDLFYYRYLGVRNGAPAWTHSSKIGNGWNFRHVLSGGDGRIFAITDSGDLMYYRYRGMSDGSPTWGPGPVKIGEGWNYR